MNDAGAVSSIEGGKLVASAAGRGKIAPQIPDTPERRRLEKQRSIREIVFGAQDGVLTTLGIVSGVGGASADRATIVITGSLALLVGALSMGAGEFLGARAERDVVQNAIDFERWEMSTMPDDEFAEQVAYYRLKGFTDEEAVMIVRRLEKNPEIWLHEMVRDEFGIDVREGDAGGFRSTIAMAGSFTLGAALPVLPYALGIPLDAARWWALAFSVATLFGIGFLAGKLGGRAPLRKGLEIVAVGAVIFGLSWAAGHFIPPLFGRGTISVGG
jgi:VIT1/CCC1 family predicted Fe2+/Mn2+ transporter